MGIADLTPEYSVCGGGGGDMKSKLANMVPYFIFHPTFQKTDLIPLPNASYSHTDPSHTLVGRLRLCPSPALSTEIWREGPEPSFCAWTHSSCSASRRSFLRSTAE
jgi:hypothetical protein